MTVPLERAQADLATLIAQVESGETITIERDGTAVAQIVRPEPVVRKRSFGVWRGKWDVPDSAFSPETEAEIEDLFYGDDA